ncbi:MAG: zinc ribbon domain-containing protein [Shewanella sp.]
MALIECPSCKKRISNKATQCSLCNANLAGDTDSMMTISHIKRSNQLMNHSMLTMTLFIAGVVIWFWGGEPAQGMRSYIASVCFVLGFVGYMITRMRMILHKRKRV